VRRRTGVLAAASGLILLSLACASGPASAGASASRAACADFAPPRRLGPANVHVPDSFLAARVGGEVVDEVVIGSDGGVRAVRSVRARLPELVPFAQASLQKSRFSPATIQGNPVAVRALVPTFVGVSRPVRYEPTHDTIWAFVPGGESRESQWQLRNSVSRLTLSLRIENPMAAGTEIVAKSASGAERSLWKPAFGTPPEDLRETVKTGDFFSAPGDYRIELRAGGKTIAFATLTIAESFETAVVNACDVVKDQ
jgi:hypothetical protein